MTTASTTVLVAGATGMLDSRIAAHLLDQSDVRFRLLLQEAAPTDSTKAKAVDALVTAGATVVLGDVTDPASLKPATAGVVGRVYNTLVPGGFDHGITEHVTPAPQVPMPPPGTSAAAVWDQIVAGRPDVPWQPQAHDVSK